MTTEFLKQPDASKTAILLIDSSGSVMGRFNDSFADTRIFDKMRHICDSLPHEEFRIVFWNSKNAPNFNGGVEKIPFVVQKSKLGTVFGMVRSKIKPQCLTMPNLAFGEIDDWLSKKYSSVVYLVTDGEIGYKNQSSSEKNEWVQLAAASISSVFDKHRDVSLNILAVQNTNLAEHNLEGGNFVGNDIYSLISKHQLTDYVSKFISYAPNMADGYAHIEKVKTPKGFVPFGNSFFSVLDVPKFVIYLANLIAQHRDDEDELLKICQKLASTLRVLTENKPADIVNSIFTRFCQMFGDTKIDAVFVNYLLRQSVQADSAGTAQLYTDYRKNLKNLYKSADTMLRSSVKDALAVTDHSFMTLPLPSLPSIGEQNDSKGVLHVVCSDINDAKESVCGYDEAASKISDKVLPILPVDATNSAMAEQCLRQWTRTVASQLSGINSRDDEIIFLIMEYNLRVQMQIDAAMAAANVASNENDGAAPAPQLQSDIANMKKIQNAYRRLVKAMLGKKRRVAQQTELESLMEGNLFVPNVGGMDRFGNYLRNCATRMFGDAAAQAVQPLQLWYFLCLAYSSDLAQVQFAQCRDAIGGESAPSYDSLPKVLQSIEFHFLATDLDYTCLITMESTASTGGYRFLPHGDQDCQPRQVLSAEGFEAMFNSQLGAYCPVCYTPLTRADFEWIGPAVQQQNGAPDLSAIDTHMFEKNYQRSRGTTSGGSSSSSSNSSSVSSSNYSGSRSGGGRGTLILLRGTVGSGKTTYAEKLKQLARDAGYTVFHEGADKYWLRGCQGNEAMAQVSRALQNAMSSSAAKKLVIVDTCGVQTNAKQVFGQDFSRWNVKRVTVNFDGRCCDLDDFMAWSLRNVLTRDPETSVLNVLKSGLSTCVNVHLKKAKGVYGKKKVSPVSGAASAVDKDQLIASLNERAQKYQTFLEQNAEKFAPSLSVFQ